MDHVPRSVEMIITSPVSEEANLQEMKSGRLLEGPRNYFNRRSDFCKYSFAPLFASFECLRPITIDPSDTVRGQQTLGALAECLIQSTRG
jgi:hypothetical protein